MEIRRMLKKRNIDSLDLHSGISQTRRQIILGKFKQGNLNVIVATDVAARGIDIPEINLVIQVGSPSQGIDYYIHRSGRTGRAGRIGTSVLINNHRDDSIVKDVIKRSFIFFVVSIFLIIS